MIKIIPEGSRLNCKVKNTNLSKTSRIRNRHGYGIAPIFAMAFIAAVTIGTTLVSTGKNFADFQLKANQVTNYDTASLATATEVARMSNNFLEDFRTSLRKSIASSRIEDMNSCSEAPQPPAEETPETPPPNPQPNGGQPNTGTNTPPAQPAPTGPSYGNYCQTAAASNPQMCNFSNNPAYQSYIDCVHQKYPGFTWAYTTCRNETGYQGPLDPNLTQNCLGMTGSMSCYGNPNMARRARTNNDAFRNNNFKAKKKKGKGKKGKGNKGKKGKKGKGGKNGNGGNGGNKGPTFAPKRDPLTTGETLPEEEPECVPNPQPIYDNPQNIVERKGYFRDYANEIKEYKAPSSEVVKTLDYGLEQGREQVHSDRDFKLMGSIALAPQIEKTDPKYASMLIGKNNFDFKSRTFSEDEIKDYHRNYTTNDGLIKLSPEVINALVDNSDPNTTNFFTNHEEEYGIKRSPNGIKFKDLVSGLDLDIEVVVKKPTETTPTKVTTATRKSVAQLRFATGQAEGFCNDGRPVPPDGVCPPTLHCPVTNRVVQASGACLNDLAAEGCPCFCDVHVTAPACDNSNGNNNGGGCPNGKQMINGFCQDPGTITLGISGLIPGEYRTLVQDPSAPISPSNPLIIWRPGGTQPGNYVAVYPDAEGNLIYEHGTGLTKTELTNAGYQDITDTSIKPIISTTNNGSIQGGHFEVKTPTFGRRRITKVDKGGVINGVPIPPGSVFVPLIKTGEDRSSFNSVNDFESIRVYDADGNLLGEFTPKQLEQAGFAKPVVKGVNANNKKGKGDGIVKGGNALSGGDMSEVFNSPEAFGKMMNDIGNDVTDTINTGENSFGTGIQGEHGEQDSNPLPDLPGYDQEDDIIVALRDNKIKKEQRRNSVMSSFQQMIEDGVLPDGTQLLDDEILLLQYAFLEARGELSFKQKEKMANLEISLKLGGNSNALKLVKDLREADSEYKDAIDYENAYLNNREIPCWYENVEGCKA